MRSDSVFANPSFRAHLLWVPASFTAALLLVLAAAVFVPLFQRFELGTGSEGDLVRLTGEILDLHERLWPVIGTALLCVLGCSWWLHRRMSAPLFRFMAAFRALQGGAIPDAIVIRATDYVQAECAALNELLATLREQRREQALRDERIEARLEDLAAWARSHDAALVEALAAECKPQLPAATAPA
jgi:hypothetical protein